MKIEVTMRAEHIYDLLLFHTYSRLSGFLVNVLGLAVIVAGESCFQPIASGRKCSFICRGRFPLFVMHSSFFVSKVEKDDCGSLL